MKLALCLTGLVRCWEEAYPSIKENILDKYDTDVFFAVWSELGYYSGKGYLPEKNGYIVTKENEKGFHDSGELLNTEPLFDLYKPKIVHVEDFKHFEPIAEKRKEYFTKAWTRPKNTISQGYMMYRGVQQILMYNEVHDVDYDIVFRSRPDIKFEEPLPPLTRDIFYTLAAKNKVGQGTGDWFQIGSLLQVNAFTHYFYNNLEHMYDIQQVSCPHLFVQNSILALKLPWKELLFKVQMTHSPNGPYQEP